MLKEGVIKGRYCTYLETVIHIGRLLESTGTLETIGRVFVFRSRDPSDIVISIERNTLLALGFVEELQTIIVNEDGRCSSLSGVGLHGFLQGVDGRSAKVKRAISKRTSSNQMEES
jgi:hypothetical protein